MRIGFIGAGRVGCSLGKYLKESESGWELAGYYSRSVASAREAADFTESEVFTDLLQLAKDCDAIAVTTADGAIADVWHRLCDCMDQWEHQIVLHCSGALASTVFDGADARGVTAVSLHPFYAVSDRYHSYQTLGEALLTLEGSGDRLQELDECLRAAGLAIQRISAESKTAYHAAASIASNLMVGLSELAIGLLGRCGFDREHARIALKPLMQGNLDAIMEQDTSGALTGPAERADVRTVDKHLHVLNGEDREIYRLLTKKIVEVAKIKNPERNYALLDELLDR